MSALNVTTFARTEHDVHRFRIGEWRNSKVASPCRTSSPDKICPISDSHPRAEASEYLPTFPQTTEQMQFCNSLKSGRPLADPLALSRYREIVCLEIFSAARIVSRHFWT